MPSAISVLVAGAAFTGWDSISVTTSLGSVAASLQLTGASAPARTLTASEPVEVRHESQTVFRGYLDDLDLAITKDSTSFAAGARSFAADMIDSQIDPIGGPGPLSNQTIESVVRRYQEAISRVTPVDASLLASSLRIPEFAYNPGETYWAAIERALRFDGVLATAGASGGIRLITPSRFERLPLQLREGDNVQAMRVSTSWKSRAHFNIARGQGSPGGDWETQLEVLGEATDESVRRSRVHVYQVEGAPTAQECRARAEWEQAVRAARGSRVTVTVPEWNYDVQGSIYRPGMIAPVALPSIGVSGSLVIESVRLTLSNDARLTQLTLVRRDAYVPQPQLTEESDTVAASWGGAS
ncbi:MAG: phage baseplate assembly protein [Planctomycetota bacterium]